MKALSQPAQPPQGEESERSPQIAVETGPPAQSSSPNLIAEYDVRDTNLPKNKLLSRTLDSLSLTLSGPFKLGAFLPLILAVFALGFLHASLPGHGNAVLASYASTKGLKYRHALTYIGTFTVTHLAYVTVLAVVLTAVSSRFDSARVTQVLRIAAGSGLIGISLLMVVKGVMALSGRGEQHHGHAHRHGNDRGEGGRAGALMGFFAGLVPCTYGWALLMMILSIGRWQMIPVVVVPFGFGIFLFLSLLAAGVMILRDIVTSAFRRFQRYSHLVSGVLLLVFSIVFMAPWAAAY